MLCEQISEIEIVKVFNNPEKLLSEAPLLDFDLCILDIEMPDLNGIAVANLLIDKHIIFTTAYKEFAVEAFDLDAVDYITKPVKKERLEKAITKVVNRIKKDEKKQFISLNTNKGKSVLFFENILYIKSADSDSRDKIAYLKDNSQLTLKNISYESLQKKLPENKFCRINKSETIAIDVVNFFTHDEITTKIILSDGKPLVLTLGTSYREDFLNML
ncbi:LytR/AlgR family response regulator transcription factor [Flavobacterium sp. I3-2]|uniref:LytR/AlgR family response regulator transcription factor n=1 Tax=Flavobacterium sp. I3-2 TaxID=2748319 RepID=UPI00293BB1EE|nr:response regulator [Flavobacterium sp. I3-2]